MLMILARLVRSESFWAVVKVRSPHNGPEVSYPRPAPSWLTATKRIASRQPLWFLHLPVFLPLAGLQRPPRWDASLTKASARASQLRWCTPEVYRRCACCKEFVGRRELRKRQQLRRRRKVGRVVATPRTQRGLLVGSDNV